MKNRKLLYALALTGLFVSAGLSAGAQDSRVLVIGVDGLRADAMEFANTPNIDALIANGLYLATAVIDPVGDSAVLLRLGCPVWVLVLFGIITVPVGFLLWHGQARHFGFGPEAQPVNPNQTISLTLFVLLLIVLESLLSARL